MTVTLRMMPTVAPMPWEEFCNTTEPYSIAIDGFVNVGPRFQDLGQGGPRANYNHHEEVDRLSTRATCAQILMSVRTGFFETFRKDGQPHCDVYAHDCDQDICTSYFLLKYGWVAENCINPNLNKLVHMEDMLDTTGGAYPFPKDMPILQQLAWVFQPYTHFRLSGGLNRRDPEEFTSIVEGVEHRILRYLHGEGKSIPIDVRYERIGGGSGWTMVREQGAQARTGMLADGIKAFVSVRERADGNYSYTVGRMSHLISFDVPKILARLTEAEGDSSEPWGGGNTIGGSPRSAGSKLNPNQVAQIVNDHQRIWVIQR